MNKVSVAAALALAVAPSVALAAPAGLAWDSVTKMEMGADPATLQPGSFAQDYSAAASSTPDFMRMMRTGFAERHYVAGSKERTDMPALGTATILDCDARTLTSLDLKKKTYSVTSLDQPNSSPGSSKGGGGPFNGDDAKIAIAITNTSLGSRQIETQATDGYRSQMQITITRASGESVTHDGTLLAYYTSFGMPSVPCSTGMPANPRSMNAGQGFGMLSGVASQVMRALRNAGLDRRFSVQQGGPALPLGNFAMYQAISFDMRGRAMTVVTERGNSRPIDAGDPLLRVPSDFTKQ
jgi:hypothetical protein